MAYNTKNKHRLMMQKLYWNGKKKVGPDDVMEYDEAQQSRRQGMPCGDAATSRVALPNDHFKTIGKTRK